MLNHNHLQKRIQDFQYQHQRRNKVWRIFKIIFFAVLVSIIVISTFSYKVIFSQNSAISGIGRLPVIKQFRQLMGMENLKGELDDRINFLLLGQGGIKHEGPYLTDTIILGSIKPSTREIALISIPRDFYLEIKGHGWHKINTANSIGEINHFNEGGAGFAAKVVRDIFNLPIHYWLRVDFDAFQQIIDDLGGITVCVDRSFEDHYYPTKDFKTQTISFKAGCQKMNGETALKFVRSRHGNNNEGSDFARAARQQKVILALKDKIFSLGTLTSPQKIYNLYSHLKNHIQTNIKLSEILHFLKLIQNAKGKHVRHIVLDNSPKGLLRADITQDGAYILLPRTNNFKELRNLAKNIFIISNGHKWEPINIIVLNGTHIENWARNTAGYLISLGFNILKTDNTPELDNKKIVYEKTVVYNLKNNNRKDIITVLRKSLDANVTNLVPEFLNKEIKKYQNADFLIVLGCSPDDKKCQVEEGKSIDSVNKE